MRNIFSKILILLFILIFIPQNANSANIRTLTIGITQFPSSFNPLIDSMMAKSYILAFVRRPLTLYDENWQQICYLCTELPSFENKRARIVTKTDGSKIIEADYTIIPEAKWADGVEITTDDIIFTWEVGKNPKVGISNFKLFSEEIADIRVKDKKNFTVVFDKLKCDFAGLDDFLILPAHLEKEIFLEDAVNYKNKTLYDSDVTNAGLYMGPYVIDAVELGASVTLRLNPNWWGKKPKFDKIIIKTIENTAALSTNLLSGDIDYIAGEMGLMVDEALALEKRLKRIRPDKFQVIYKTGLIYEHIDLNLDNPNLQNIDVRQALLYGLNREAISKYLFAEKQPVAHVNIHPLDKEYFKNVKKYPYDTEKANNLLEQAGWKLNSDNLRYNDKGDKLSFTLMTTAGNRSRELVAQAIQSDWKKIGVDVKIENEPARVFFGDTVRKRKFKDGAMFAWLSAPDNVPKTTLHSEMIPTRANNYAGQNYTGFKNSQMDKILDNLEVVCEEDKRTALWYKMQEIYTEELPALPLYYRANSFIMPKWLKNIKPTGHQYPTSLWVENWSVE